MSFVDDGVLPAFVPRYEARSDRMSDIPRVGMFFGAFQLGDISDRIMIY